MTTATVEKSIECRAAGLTLKLLALCLALCCVCGHAEPSVPYMPSPIARHEIEILVDEGGLELPVTQWPLPRAAVRHAVDRLPPALPERLDAARRAVLRELEAQAASAMTLSVRTRGHALDGFGGDATPGSSLLLRTDSLDTEHFAMQIGTRSDAIVREGQGGTHLGLEGSALVAELAGVELQAWSHRSWWGPGWQSSLALSNNAPAFTGAGFQRASASRSESPWLSWLGPWNFEFFIAQIDSATAPTYPYLIGNRLTLRPFSNVELGITRMAQWGGSGKTQSARSFVDALAGTSLNADSQQQQANDPANELAGFDARIRCPAGLPCATYAQIMGEDQAGLLPSHYLGLYGVEAWSGDSRYFAEYAETGCSTPIGRPEIKGCAYRNYVYPGGYASGGRWIGSDLGPDSRVATLGWLQSQDQVSVRVHFGRVGSRAVDFSAAVEDPLTAGRLFGVSAQRSWSWGPASVTPQIDWSRVQAADGAHVDRRFGATVQLPLDSAFDTSAAALGTAMSSQNTASLSPLWAGAGLVALSALLDHQVDTYASHRAGSPSARALHAASEAIPVLAMGAAGASWLWQHGEPQGDLALSALGAGVSAYALSDVTKYAVGRARPTAGLGASSFGDVSRGDSSFPSNHAAVAWAALTPYAKAYDAPWLYGLAAVTNAGRVMGRDHWLSDTVAGAALGYFVGDWWWHRGSGETHATDTQLLVTPRSIVVKLPFE